MTVMNRKDAESPVGLFLSREYPEQKETMQSYLQFVSCAEGMFHYRNKVTRSILIVDSSGNLVSCAKDALHTISIYVALYPKRKYRRKALRA